MIQNIQVKKCITLISLLFIYSAFFTHAIQGQTNVVKNEAGRTLKLMTYNLKFASPDFKPTWDERREMQVELIRKYNPDIIGTQEGLKEQIDWLADNFQLIDRIGCSRNIEFHLFRPLPRRVSRRACVRSEAT